MTTVNTQWNEAVQAGERLKTAPRQQRHTNASFPAKWASDCVACTSPIFRGVQVSYLDKKVVHHTCAVKVVEQRCAQDDAVLKYQRELGLYNQLSRNGQIGSDVQPPSDPRLETPVDF